VSSTDLWGESTALIGARIGLLREKSAPLDLGVGVSYQPQAIRGDGLIMGTVSLGKKIGPVSSFATLGYGQDGEGDDRMGMTSVGALVGVSERLHLGLDSRARFQLASHDAKSLSFAEPTMDFCAGPLLAYSLGAFDLTAQGGVAGLMLRGPKDARGEPTTLQLGPLMLLGVGAAL
jgi:hypothetical protein